MNEDFKAAKRSLQSIQEQLKELKAEEREAKIEFLKTIPLGEEFMDFEGNKFLFIGFQIKPEPVALAEWPGGVSAEELDCIKENFLTWEDFDATGNKRWSFEVSPCQKCGKVIPSEMQICSKCEREDEETYPCPVCKREIPATEPFCRDCMNDVKSKAA